MSLSAYNKKRDFKQTAEPQGKAVKDGKDLLFVVQRHDASHLHYDFRLELDGVLKSWAVPKGPSRHPKDRRLAVQVEDHPVSYATFSGDIPAGNYGAGHVDVWDTGTYQPVGDRGEELSPAQALAQLHQGHLRFTLKGKKLQGGFRLFRMKEDDKNWLLMKSADQYAVDEPYDIEAEAATAAGDKKKDPPAPKKKKNNASSSSSDKDDADEDEEKYTHYIHPMMARLHDAPFDDDGWIFEIKWDGYRAIAECGGPHPPRLYSRNGSSFAAHYPAVAAAIKSIQRPMVLDGEIVAFNKEGKPDFQLLQNALNNGAELLYYVFDLLYLDGKSIEHLPVTQRKKLLQEALPAEDNVLRYCDHVAADGTAFFRAMQQQGLEGMIAKKANSIYTEGQRSPDWLKVKHVITDEAVICGYTQPKGARQYFGALLLGDYSTGSLRYIGHTGTGFNTTTLRMLYQKMQPLRTTASPFGAQRVPVNAAVTWLQPELVCNVKYTEVTKEGIRRHPVFMGLRKDKAATEVTREDAAPLPPPQKAAASSAATAEAGEDSIKAGRHTVAITNRQKVFWPQEGYTKGDVIDYYNAISQYILPYLKGRPLSLRRNPNGIRDAGFFHKDAGDNAPTWVRTEAIRSESSDRDVDYIVADNRATLLYLANLGCIELNPWHSRVGKLDRPDYMVIDLDPSDQNTFDQVIDTAKAVKQVLDRAGAPAYCKTSGSTGLHIYVPMGGKYTYEQVNRFAEIVATQTVALLPGFTSLERSLKKRGPNIYLDYMQNNIGQTVAAPYSLRPKPGATVSAPLDWKELRRGLDMQRFTLRTMARRLSTKGDLFKPVLGRGINMPAVLKGLGV